MAQSVPPGDIQTQPVVKIAKVINPSARPPLRVNPSTRPPNGIKTTNTKRSGVDSRDPMFCRPSLSFRSDGFSVRR
ncbi:hypothetical protein CRE_06286 [Caenorhabditis remanei]|uniref:Uncharacterized protein n=1 Tax=Caenorhabditis remanei TaxID=31234 RepID=E3NX39_CAERE|nr:hypothetical protein CRE_06286 [Caenorhabditis remanei]